MIEKELEEILQLQYLFEEKETLAKGAAFLNRVAADTEDPHKAVLDAIVVRIVNDGDLLVPIGTSDQAAVVFANHAYRAYTGRRDWGDGEIEVLEFE